MAEDSRNTDAGLDAEGFRLGGQVYHNADMEARARITELEQKIAELEKRPQIFAGTEEEIQNLSAQGRIRIGDFAITLEGDEADSGGTDAGTDQEGQGTPEGQAAQ